MTFFIKYVKGIVILALIVLGIGSSMGVGFASDEVKIFINGQKLISDTPPQIIEGNTFVPLKVIFDALSIDVKWDGTTQTITGTKDETKVVLQIGNKVAIVGNESVVLNIAPQIINSRTMVPVKFISESVGATVSWEAQTRSVLITYPFDSISLYQDGGLAYPAKVEGKDFLVYMNGEWQTKFLKGVNIGAAKPGTFPGELAITKEEYLRWFKYISEMNAEVIRVYTTLKPAFYDALYAYNLTAIKPLYLMQGVWVNEGTIAELGDAFADNERIKNNFIKDAQDLVDIFHGNATLPFQYGFASGTYTRDVSKYVIGWILGIEWDPHFVKGTNDNHPNRTTFSGDYIYTENASPFEVFLAEVGDAILAYEADKYQELRPLSFTNWLTTDMLDHPNEPLPQEDMSVVNLEHLKAREAFVPGIFASYHIYPYYPDFINYQKEYTSFIDDTGKVNTYKAYLKDLIAQHQMPVLVAEFGVPASRGKAHDSIYSGYNQGQHDETEQGLVVSHLIEDIHEEGYFGSLIFAWQDEWFKRTWNTMDLDMPDTRPFWSNPQTNEQQFGLLAFDPGETESIAYVDNSASDWANDTPLQASDGVKLYVKSDEKYVYLMVDTEDYDFYNDTLYIPIDTIDGQGNESALEGKLTFSKPSDFLVQINGRFNSKIMVDAYYDSYYYIYAEQLGMIDKNEAYRADNQGVFNPMMLCLSREFYLPEDDRTIPFSSYETGLLKYGNANPKALDYNSLTDFSYHDGIIEIRLPWQLLNIMDPANKVQMANFYEKGAVTGQAVDGFSIGTAIMRGPNKVIEPVNMTYYAWEGWYLPMTHERLKPSYYIIQETFKQIK